MDLVCNNKYIETKVWSAKLPFMFTPNLLLSDFKYLKPMLVIQLRRRLSNGKHSSRSGIFQESDRFRFKINAVSCLWAREKFPIDPVRSTDPLQHYLLQPTLNHNRRFPRGGMWAAYRYSHQICSNSTRLHCVLARYSPQLSFWRQNFIFYT